MTTEPPLDEPEEPQRDVDADIEEAWESMVDDAAQETEYESYMRRMRL